MIPLKKIQSRFSYDLTLPAEKLTISERASFEAIQVFLETFLSIISCIDNILTHTQWRLPCKRDIFPFSSFVIALWNGAGHFPILKI